MPKLSKPAIYIILFAVAFTYAALLALRTEFLRATMVSLTNTTLHKTRHLSEQTSTQAQEILGWKNFESRSGWKINYPPDWKIASCVFCMKDLAAPGIYVDFYPPRNQKEWIVVEPADKPAADDKNLTKFSLNGMSAFRYSYYAENLNWMIEKTYVVYRDKAFAISFHGEGHKQLEEFVNYPIYRKILSSFVIETIDTSTWQTYRNEKYGFEVRYPNDWKIKVDKLSDGVIFQDPKYNNDDTVYIKVLKNLTFEQALDAFAFEKRNNQYFILGSASGPEVPAEEIDVNGTKGLVGEPFVRVYDKNLYTGTTTGKRVLLFKENAYALIDRELYTEKFDQILSTFKFIN